MTGKQRFSALMSGAPVDRSGFWLGNPHHETLPGYLSYFGVKDRLELAVKLSDDFAWLPSDHIGWRHPEGKPTFDVTRGVPKTRHGQDGCFAETTDPRDVDDYPWPDAAHLDLDVVGAYTQAVQAAQMAVVGGAWSSFFHTVADFFGMENYFAKMYTDPKVVDAVTERVVQFYFEANARVFERFAPDMDAYFLGNDFGTQLDLLISPTHFRRYVMPGFKKLIDQAKSYGLRVMLHSCGAISRVIPDLLEAGVDALHPLQARARGMEAESLAVYRDRMVFVGGVDTQQLLPYGTPEQVRAEVLRLRELWGPRMIVSPSHEALLPNVPPENVEAMWRAAIE